MPYGPHPSVEGVDVVAELGALAGRRMAWGRPLCWARPLTHAAYADPADAEFTLVGHVRRADALILEVVERVGGERSLMEVKFPQPRSWRLHEVLPGPAPAAAQDAEGAARRKRDEMLRRVFS